MKPCPDFQDMLIDYADGHLPEGDRRYVERHLAECAHCRSRLAEHRWLSGLVYGALVQSLRPPKLLWPARPEATQPRVGWRRPALVAAALAAIAIGVMSRQSVVKSPGEVAAPRAIATSAPTSDQRQFAELQIAIEREACAAQLAMSAELLGAEPAAKQYAADALRFLAETYPETKAGSDAARRIGLESPDLKEPL